MIIYTVDNMEDAVDGMVACATLKEAREVARENAGNLTKINTGKLRGRALACALFNHSGYAATQEEIKP